MCRLTVQTYATTRIVSIGLLALVLCWGLSTPCRTSLAGEDVPNAASTSPTPPRTVPSAKPASSETPAEPVKELYAGKVVLLLDVLKQRGIKATEEAKGQVVLETDKGDIFPLIPDWRGRAFFQDERLRNRQVELVARRHKGLPYLQVLMVFTFNEKGERQYTDYWCDICSIPMYEIKDCDCCRGPVRLRFQKQDLPGYLKPN